ncbi:MAG TPA: STAS domain-containing protein [Acidimicrobiales bacterium]|jgi:anti-anti-sigma factor|nr:STAS domain-containing protein [Acidimicrobiales bacterium]
MSFGVLAASTRTASGQRPVLTRPIVQAEGDRTVVVLQGEVDFATRPILSDALSRVIAWRVGDVVIDLSEATFIDTAIIRALAVANELLERSGRRMTFRSPSRVAAQVMQLFGLTDLIEVSGNAGV